MKPNFSPSLFPLCASVPLWFKFQICLARIGKMKELGLLVQIPISSGFTEV